MFAAGGRFGVGRSGTGPLSVSSVSSSSSFWWCASVGSSVTPSKTRMTKITSSYHVTHRPVSSSCTPRLRRRVRGFSDTTTASEVNHSTISSSSNSTNRQDLFARLRATTTVSFRPNLTTPGCPICIMGHTEVDLHPTPQITTNRSGKGELNDPKDNDASGHQ